jgi:hypothetical protein
LLLEFDLVTNRRAQSTRTFGVTTKERIMKRIAIMGLLLLLSTAAIVQARNPERAAVLPILNRVFTATLSPSYSCRPKDGFARGYEGTALFLSGFSRSRNAPDLLFNGACNADDYFHASTAGDDMALIADIGPGVNLTNLSAHTAFNIRNIGGYDNESRFVRSLPVILGHTYVVLLNKSDVRGLFLLNVIAYERNKSITVQYTVKQYQRIQVVDKSAGFDWVAPSTSEEKP